jgi:hypothetical protein
MIADSWELEIPSLRFVLVGVLNVTMLQDNPVSVSAFKRKKFTHLSCGGQHTVYVEGN